MQVGNNPIVKLFLHITHKHYKLNSNSVKNSETVVFYFSLELYFTKHSLQFD